MEKNKAHVFYTLKQNETELYEICISESEMEDYILNFKNKEEERDMIRREIRTETIFD